LKTLLLMRHAKSSWKHTELNDHDRPLAKRGKCDAPRMGQLVRQEELVPQLILSSTAVRARVTAEIVAEESGYEEDVVCRQELYAFDAEPYLEVLADLPDDFQRVMVVGHNPAMEELTTLLTGEAVPLPTAALVLVTLPIDRWRELEEDPVGKLVNFWRPEKY